MLVMMLVVSTMTPSWHRNHHKPSHQDIVANMDACEAAEQQANNGSFVLDYNVEGSQKHMWIHFVNHKDGTQGIVGRCQAVNREPFLGFCFRGQAQKPLDPKG